MTARRVKNYRRTERDGHVFGSLAERERYDQLRLLERAGEIGELEVHPVVVLQPRFEYRGRVVRPITYEADFRYRRCRDGILVVEDVKGHKEEVFRLKWKILQYRLRQNSDVELEIVSANEARGRRSRR